MKCAFHETSAGAGSGTAAVSGGSDRFAHISFVGSPRPATLRAGPVPVLRPIPAAVPRPAAAKPEADPESAALVRRIVHAMGLPAREYRLLPMVRRVPACLRALHAATSAEAHGCLDQHPELMPRALDALLIGTTEFFRDTPVFDALQHALIPALLERKAHPRVWSAACSDGAELYSIAMTIALFGELREGQFLGTDCRREAVEHARRGEFARPRMHGLREPQRSLFAIAGHDSFGISPAIRRAIAWRTGDVLADDPGGPWDMILCRNLAIYLDPEAVSRLWHLLASALAPGGILVVGKAERPAVPGLRRIHPSIYCKDSIP